MAAIAISGVDTSVLDVTVGDSATPFDFIVLGAEGQKAFYRMEVKTPATGVVDSDKSTGYTDTGLAPTDSNTLQSLLRAFNVTVPSGDVVLYIYVDDSADATSEDASDADAATRSVSVRYPAALRELFQLESSLLLNPSEAKDKKISFTLDCDADYRDFEFSVSVLKHKTGVFPSRVSSRVRYTYIDAAQTGPWYMEGVILDDVTSDSMSVTQDDMSVIFHVDTSVEPFTKDAIFYAQVTVKLVGFEYERVFTSPLYMIKIIDTIEY